jgi:hypothetical protein
MPGRFAYVWGLIANAEATSGPGAFVQQLAPDGMGAGIRNARSLHSGDAIDAGLVVA